jgi:hypothetical protein
MGDERYYHVKRRHRNGFLFRFFFFFNIILLPLNFTPFVTVRLLFPPKVRKTHMHREKKIEFGTIFARAVSPKIAGS